MIDALGHACYALIWLGAVLIAHRRAGGWALRAVGDAGWVVLGIALGLSSVVVWGAFFTALDLVGWRKWTREKSALDSSRACKLPK